METEGVVQYRILGSHPAASGRYYSYGFSGDTLPVDVFVQDIIKQHRLNLTKYKLELSCLAPVDGERKGTQSAPEAVESRVLGMNSLVRSYDRIIINVLRRHYLDGAVGASQGGEQRHEDRLQNVKHLLMKEEESSGLQTSSNAFVEKRSCGGDDEAKDPDAFLRVTALSHKAFPLLPCMRRQVSASALPLPRPIKGKCVLCELDCFKEVVLQCCNFSVCRSCLELAKVMLVGGENDGEECVVCGVVLGGKKTKDAVCPMVARASVKREGGTCAGAADIDERQRGRRGVSSSSVCGSGGVHSRIVSRVAAFEAELTGNMARILSLLDVADPLTRAAKEKRQVSTTITSFYNE